MHQPGEHLLHTYDVRLVVLSGVLAALAAYTAFDLAARVTAARRRVRVAWLLGSAVAMGIGIWSMHFTAMLAVSSPLLLTYDLPTVLLSVLIAILAAGIALYAIRTPVVALPQLLGGGVAMGVGIAAMHYVGMAAMRMPAVIVYHPFLVGLSVVIAMGASIMGLWLAVHMRTVPPGTHPWLRLKLVSALMMGGAIAAMHYTGMAAATFLPTHGALQHQTPVLNAGWLAVAIGTTTLIILCLALLTSVVDRRFAVQAAALHASDQRYTALFEGNPDAVFAVDRSGRVLRVNPACERMLGYPVAELGQRVALSVVQPHDRARVRHAAAEVFQQGTPHTLDLQARHKDGHCLDLTVTLIPTTMATTSGGMYGIAKDITQRKRMEGQLAHQAFHDPLTTLPNRTFFLEQLTRALARAKRQQTSVAVLFVDLDRFKVINDSLGHPVGDQLLITVAERLQACVRVGDTVARLGGDEFTLLLEALPTVQGAMEVAERIHTALQAPFPLDGRNVFTSASIGIALSMPETDHPDDLLRAADSAMYQAKVAGKAQFALFDPHHTTAVQERLDLETALRYAIARDELRVEYQPIVQLTTGWVVGVEALVRWMHPQHGLLPPARFIPIAEETGQIRAIGRWVLEQACRQVRAWHTVRPSAAPLMLTVNLSAREFQHLDLVDDLCQLVQDTGFDPTTLTLELTESVTMQDAAATIGTLHKLKALGVRIAIDDFGTGYSSLAYLKRFPITTVKIDRSFVREIPSDPNDAAIVTAIIAMAHQLHLHVVAEGVETPAQGAFLQAHGCDALQGYLISRPLPAEQVLPLLQRGPWLLPAAAGSTSAQDREPSTGGGRTSRHTARGEWTWG